MAELPIWSFSKGSSTSFKLANRRTVHKRIPHQSLICSRHLSAARRLTVGANLVDGSSETSQRSQHVRIDLSRISLSGDWISIGQPGQLGHSLVERFDLVVVPVKEGQEAPLSPRGPLDSSETDIVPRTFEVSQVPQEFLDPQGSSLADGGQLGGLEVSETEGGEVSVGLGELGKTGDDRGELGEEDVESVSQEDQVGVATRSRYRRRVVRGEFLSC
jgi:hypothetical protein